MWWEAIEKIPSRCFLTLRATAESKGVFLLATQLLSASGQGLAFPPVLAGTMLTPPAQRGFSPHASVWVTDFRINRGFGFLMEDTPEHVLIFGNEVFLMYFI